MTNFVLIHGAATGGRLRDAQAWILAQRSHRTLAPALAGVGDRVGDGGPNTDLSTHIDEIVEAC